MDEPWITAEQDRIFPLTPGRMDRIRIEAGLCTHCMEHIFFKYLKSYLDKEVLHDPCYDRPVWGLEITDHDRINDCRFYPPGPAGH